LAAGFLAAAFFGAAFFAAFGAAFLGAAFFAIFFKFWYLYSEIREKDSTGLICAHYFFNTRLLKQHRKNKTKTLKTSVKTVHTKLQRNMYFNRKKISDLL